LGLVLPPFSVNGAHDLEGAMFGRRLRLPSANDVNRLMFVPEDQREKMPRRRRRRRR